MQTEVVANQVETMLVDIVLDVAPDTAILAQEQFKTLMELLPMAGQTNPQMMPKLLKVAIMASDLPDKRELRQELEKGPDPQQMQLQQQAQQLQQALAQANLKLTETAAQLNVAKAAQAQADAQTTVPLAQAEIQEKGAKTQIASAKVPSEIQVNEARAMHSAAAAGEKAGGGLIPQGVM
jgi:predicted DsbA family dithiol-disulfide isomerase